MIYPPFNKKLCDHPSYRPCVNFFVKTFFRIRKIREMELDFGITENNMESNRLMRILSKWKIRKEQEMKNA